ncbi:MAG: DDE-type integrase/transposase/recombinase, partial [Solirubrobacteraceae bacterium]
LRVTAITEHPTREGKIYCCVVLDTFSRKVAGWSIDSTQTARLVLNALGMATQRPDRAGLVIHSDRGVQAGLNRSSQQCVGDWTVRDTPTRLSSWRRERSEWRSGDSPRARRLRVMPRSRGGR